eukprot:CAMPEP_0180172492 /NCGR_PEP_ID=MMETSP0986-20121125/35052_1 /TAXON_ID=697907 /ORGANISM="non described non described, Strain CCMP2293" /LENGTH=87 /DNA_ID=CAMNT_0022124579 /DNA_START=183 /DNA_END=443 /DNA_ORIENTATION=+
MRYAAATTTERFVPIRQCTNTPSPARTPASMYASTFPRRAQRARATPVSPPPLSPPPRRRGPAWPDTPRHHSRQDISPPVPPPAAAS